jgi:hypothetical protein
MIKDFVIFRVRSPNNLPVEDKKKWAVLEKSVYLRKRSVYSTRKVLPARPSYERLDSERNSRQLSDRFLVKLEYLLPSGFGAASLTNETP